MTRIAEISLVLIVFATSYIAQIPQSKTKSTPTPIYASSDSLALKEIETSLQVGRFGEAQAKAQALLKKEPDNALIWTYLGMAFVRLNQPDQAIQAFEKSISINPQDPHPYLDVALLYASQSDLDKAIDRYQKALAIDDQNGTGFYNYGRILMTKGRVTQAIAALKRALQNNGADTEARIALVEAHLRAKQREEASEQVKVLLQSNGLGVPAIVSLGAMLVRGGEVELARTILARALSMAPDLSAVHLEFSRLYLATNDPQKAVQSAKRALELAPTSLEANLALAEAFISGRQNLQALEHLSKVRSQFGRSAAFYYTLGIAQFRVNSYQPAIDSFKRAVQLDPRLDLAHFLLGNACLSTGDLEQAGASFKAAVALNSKNVLYYNYLARVYEQKGDAFKEAALESTDKALALDAKDVEARERLAKWAKEEGDLPRARALLEQVIADAPAYVSARVLLASVYYRLNLRSAGDEQQKVIRSLETEAQKNQRRPPEVK